MIKPRGDRKPFSVFRNSTQPDYRSGRYEL